MVYNRLSDENMFSAFKYSLIISIVITLILLLMPLIVIVSDFLKNPECLVISSEKIEQVGGEQYRALLRISYCSSVSLKELKLVIGSREIVVNDLTRGIIEKEIILTTKDLEIGIKRVEANILGIYRLAFNIT